MRLAQLSFGLALGVGAGVVFGKGWTAHQELWWWVGTLALLTGALLMLFAVRGPHHIEVISRPGDDAQWGRSRSAPLLGEILVNCSLISSDDLNRALARQRGSNKRLGQILVDMKVLTHQQLAEVLEEQISRRAGRTSWPQGSG